MGWVAGVARRGQARALRVAGRTCGVYRGTKSTRLTSNSPFSAYEQLARDCAASGGAPAAKAAAAAAWAAYKDTFPEGAAAPSGCAREGASSAERSVRLTGPRHLTVAGSGEAEPPDNGVHVRDKKRLASFFITSLGVASLPGALPEALLLSPARSRVFFDWWEEQNKARHDINGPGGSTTPW